MALRTWGFLCDLETLQCLAAGVVNSRAEVNAKRALADYEASIFVLDERDDREDPARAVTMDRVGLVSRVGAGDRLSAGLRACAQRVGEHEEKALSRSRYDRYYAEHAKTAQSATGDK